MNDRAGDPDLVSIGRITKTQGRRGELFAILLTDFPDRFEELRAVLLQFPQGQLKLAEVEHTWYHKQGVVLKLRGVDDITTAESFIGCLIQVREDQTVQLPQNTYYWHDLIGCTAYSEAGEIQGVVEDVKDFGGNQLLTLQVPGGQEVLVPLARAFVLEVDVAQKRIVTRIPEALMQLNT